jgi:hypothetical protein
MPAFVKYTVFLSSTHDDLKQEREQVADAILKLGHIPCGMEQFSAGSGRGWNVITQTIDICDYYVLIVAGRYGTMFPAETVSWTEKEYDYARGRGLDPLAFLRRKDHIIGSRMDDEPSAIMSRQAFIRRIDDECRREVWTTSDDLCVRVTMALTKQIADDQRLGKSRPGWFRGDDLPGEARVTNELARLSAENGELRAALARALAPLKPIVQVQTRHGDPIPEKLDIELVEYSMTPDPELTTERPGTPASIQGQEQAGVRVSEEELREAQVRRLRLTEWVSQLSRLFWIRLQVANSGPVPARDIRVRVTVSPAQFVAYAELSSFNSIYPSIGNTVEPNSDTMSGRVIRESAPEAEEAVILHQVPSIGVNRKELLWGMAFLAIGDLTAEQIVTVKVSMDEETGVRSEGQVELHLTKGSVWSGNALAIRDHADTSRGMLRE